MLAPTLSVPSNATQTKQRRTMGLMRRFYRYSQKIHMTDIDKEKEKEERQRRTRQREKRYMRFWLLLLLVFILYFSLPAAFFSAAPSCEARPFPCLPLANSKAALRQQSASSISPPVRTISLSHTHPHTFSSPFYSLLLLFSLCCVGPGATGTALSSCECLCCGSPVARWHVYLRFPSPVQRVLSTLDAAWFSYLHVDLLSIASLPPLLSSLPF